MCENAIISTPVPDDHRLNHTDKIFGNYWWLAIEPTIFMFADRLSPNYHGGYWEFYEISNGGFYMAPLGNQFEVISENGWSGVMSTDAFGICCCLYAYSHTSFVGNKELAELCSMHYHLLRELIFVHPDAKAILAAVD